MLKKIFWVFAVWIFPTLAFASMASITHVHGTVDERPSGSVAWQAIFTGQPLQEGDEIRTEDHSEADVTLEQGHRLHLSPNSTLHFTRLTPTETEGQLEIGKVLSKVNHLKPDEHFTIKTPTIVCGVRGTQFETSYDRNGLSTLNVYRGIVVAGAPGHEIAVYAGQQLNVLQNGTMQMPRSISSRTYSSNSPLAQAARHEVGLEMNRIQVLAAAAEERRLADYQEEGKSLIDVNGNRVRLEEYIVRPQPDQFKLVALDERDSRLDYFFYLGTLNQAAPADLSVALRDLSGTFGTTAPNYYLTGYEMGQSNTQDSVHDIATGGHLVKITLDNAGNYQLVDPTNPSNNRTILAAAQQSDGSYKIYDPLTDTFFSVPASQKDISSQFSIYVRQSDAFQNIQAGDTVYETRFNSYTHQLDDITKIAYTKNTGITNVLSTPLDANYVYAGGSVTPVVTVDPNNIDATVTNYYGDGTFESYRTVLIDDLGAIAPQSAFNGVSTGAAYNNELLHWNYEQQVTATEFQGRKIDLVVEPKIFIESGLIQ